MNDRFKFRAWDKINDEWVKIPHLSLDVETGMLNGFFDYTEAAKRRYTLEQCTGLRDKNGKLIYEGDILTDGANTFIVNWYDDMALFRLLYKNDNRETYCLFYPDDAASKYTVIGNIHEETEK